MLYQKIISFIRIKLQRILWFQRNFDDLKILSGGKKLDDQFYLENYLQWVDYSKTNLMKKLLRHFFLLFFLL